MYSSYISEEVIPSLYEIKEEEGKFAVYLKQWDPWTLTYNYIKVGEYISYEEAYENIK